MNTSDDIFAGRLSRAVNEENSLSSSSRNNHSESPSSPSRNNHSEPSSSSSSDNRPKPSYYAPIKRNTLRRKEGHDYYSPSIYLITVSTFDHQRLLGTLVGDTADVAKIVPTTLGNSVINLFKGIEAYVLDKTGCHVQILQYQLMPDHFHGIIHIKDQLPSSLPLGRIIGRWKGACSRALWALSSPSSSPASSSSPSRNNHSKPPSSPSSPSALSSSPSSDNRPKLPPLFSDGFNDRVLNRQGQLQHWITYLRNNPRRLWIKYHFPDRYRKKHEFAAGKSRYRFTAMGESFLVTYPERAQVRCHRNLSDAEIQAEVARYLDLARSGVVLVSPFISPGEKAVYEACYAEHLKMIRIINRGIDGQFKFPSGRDLEGCYAGFLLVLAPYMEGAPETADVRISRAQCLNLNAFAEDLATI